MANQSTLLAYIMILFIAFGLILFFGIVNYLHHRKLILESEIHIGEYKIEHLSEPGSN